MGQNRNASEDCPQPFAPMYSAARSAGRLSRHLGDARWDFSSLVDGPIPMEARGALWSFLRPLWNAPADAPACAWKLPETCFVYPWLVRLFPEARFLWWVRDPRDVIMKDHGTDRLDEWGVKTGLPRENNYTHVQRAYSWLYQEQVVSQTPSPRHLLRVRMEDWCRDQAAVNREVTDFIGLPVRTLVVRSGRIGRWRGLTRQINRWSECIELLTPAMRRHGYIEG